MHLLNLVEVTMVENEIIPALCFLWKKKKHRIQVLCLLFCSLDGSENFFKIP